MLGCIYITYRNVKIHFLEKQKLCLYCSGITGFQMRTTTQGCKYLRCKARNVYLNSSYVTRHYISRPYTNTYIHWYIDTYVLLSLFKLHIDESLDFSTHDSGTCYFVTSNTYGNPGWNTAVCNNCVQQWSVTWFSMTIEVLLIMLELFVKLEVPAFSPCRGRVRLPAALPLLATLPETWSTCNVLQFIKQYNLYA